MKVPNPPSSGKDTAKSKGVEGDCESEGSWRQTSGLTNRNHIIEDCRAFMEALADCGSIDTEMEAVSSEMEVTTGLIQKLVDENATRKLDQHDYRRKYDGYAS